MPNNPQGRPDGPQAAESPLSGVPSAGSLENGSETPCICGHLEVDHDGKYRDCAARCLCELCPPGTRNDCWCAGYRPAPSNPGDTTHE